MFKIGDKVIIDDKYMSYRGVVGTIIYIYPIPDSLYTIQVKFKNGVSGIFSQLELYPYIEVPVNQECISLTF